MHLSPTDNSSEHLVLAGCSGFTFSDLLVTFSAHFSVGCKSFPKSCMWVIYTLQLLTPCKYPILVCGFLKPKHQKSVYFPFTLYSTFKNHSCIKYICSPLLKMLIFFPSIWTLRTTWDHKDTLLYSHPTAMPITCSMCVWMDVFERWGPREQEIWFTSQMSAKHWSGPYMGGRDLTTRAITTTSHGAQ